MDNGDKTYYELEMKGRGWTFLNDTAELIVVKIKAAYDGGQERTLPIDKGALVFRKYINSRENIAVISPRGTQLYHYEGPSTHVTGQTTTFPVVTVHRTDVLFADGADTTLLGPETNKPAAGVTSASGVTSTSSASSTHRNNATLNGDDLWRSIQGAAGRTNRPSSFKLTLT